MFDIGFFELVLIGIVGLVVLGPDKLPGAIKTLGLWIGRLRRSFNNIKREIEQEIGADEIRRQLRNEAIMEKFDSTKKQFTETIDSVKKEADAVKDDLNLKKEFSDLTGETGGESGAEEPEESDPIEALATRDPAVNKEPKPAAGAMDKKASEPAETQAENSVAPPDKTGAPPETDTAD